MTVGDTSNWDDFFQQNLIPAVIAHVVAGAYFVVEDLLEPFSVSKDLARYVERLEGVGPVVVAQPMLLSYVGPVLSGYLKKPVIYVLADRTVTGSFLVLDDERARGATEEQIETQLRRFATERHSDVYVVTNNWQPQFLGIPLRHFDRHLEIDERSADVYLYRQPK